MSQSLRVPEPARACRAWLLAFGAVIMAAGCTDTTAPVTHRSYDAALDVPKGGTITVSPTGSATGAGTPSSPWTLEKALSGSAAGATIQLLNGTYHSGNLVVDHQLTIEPASGAKPIVSGSVVIPTSQWQASGSGWRTHWSTHFEPSPAENSSYYTAQFPLAGHRDMAFIDGKSLTLVANASSVGVGTFYWDAGGQWLYIGQNPSGHTVEATNQQYGFLIWVSGVHVTGLTIQHYAEAGLQVQGSNSLIDHNVIQWNASTGIGLVNTTNAMVKNNTLIYNGKKGAGVSGGTGNTFSGNVVSFNNVRHFNTYWDAAGIKAISTANIMISGNWVSDNWANAAWVDVNSTNSTFLKNTVLRNKPLPGGTPIIGIFVEDSYGTLIAGNLVYDNLTGIGVHFTTNPRVYNNTMVYNTNNLDVSAGYARPPYDLSNAVLVNNLMSTPTRTQQNLFRYNGCPSSVYHQVDYNGYYRPSGSPAKDEVIWCNLFYTTVTAYHSATGYEAHGLDIVSGGEPFFTNAMIRVFSLRAGSPAIGRGQPLPSDVAAALGLRAGVAVDMGALQH